jgi:choline dehydrogenase-like flavoprotein
MMIAAGFENVAPLGAVSTPGTSVHEMGTARMGLDPATSVLNRHNQAHDVRNLFITDGSCMVSSGTVNPSLTYMALSARAANYAADLLASGEI